MRRTRHALVGVLSTVLVLAGGAVAAGAGSSPGLVVLQTAPALGGVHLVVGSRPVTTRPDGSARVTVASINGVAATVRLASQAVDSRTSVALASVQPAPHTVRHQSHLTVGLDVTAAVRLHVAAGRTGVPSSSVHTVRLHSVTGRTRVVDPQRTPVVRLLARKARLVGGVVRPQVVTWSVDSLRAGPGVSLTTAHARFDPLSGPVWALQLQPVRGTVDLDTVPATAGVTFLLDGASFTTDSHGRATASTADLNRVDLRLGLAGHQAGTSTVSVLRVSRLKPRAPFHRRLLVALAVSRPVTLRFVDPTGRPVPTGRVTSVLLEGGGRTVPVPRALLGGPVPLLATVGRLVDGRWQTQQVTYSARRVTVEGSDAVFAGQQRFRPASGSTWPVSVAVFDVTVTVRDVLFGRRISSTAQVSRPDGARSQVALAADRATVLPSLVRGEYTLSTDSAVLGASASILVSKASEVDLRVVTAADAVVALLAVGALAGLLVLGGRESRRRRQAPPGRSAA